MSPVPDTNQERPGPVATMKNKREVGPSSQPPEHTLRSMPFPGTAVQRMIPRRSSGWDPYEVWRTRVKAPRDPEERVDLHKAG